MKGPRKRWWVVLLGAVVLGAGAIWWVLNPPRPTLSFLEFRNLGQERCAVFVLQNDSSRAFLLQGSHWASNREPSLEEPDVKYMVHGTRYWPSFPGVFGKFFVIRIEPRESREVFAPTTIYHVAEHREQRLTTPFRAGLKLQPDFMWLLKLGRPLGWNGGETVLRLQREAEFEIWSEVVTP